MSHDHSPDSSTSLFPPTAWTFIQKAQQLPREQYVSARNEFLGRYWRPVFCYLRARGYPAAEAEDLAQGFFERFLEQDALRRADPQRGRFRSYLLTVLIRYLSDRRNPARLSGQERFERQLTPMSVLARDDERPVEALGGETPEAAFLRQWAVDLLRTVQDRLRQRCDDAGRPEWYRVFLARLGAADDGRRATRDGLARELRITPDQVRYAAEKTRLWFEELLHSEVRQHVDSDAEVLDEIRDLRTALGAGAGGPPAAG